jgi:hypothetical protein
MLPEPQAVQLVGDVPTVSGGQIGGPGVLRIRAVERCGALALPGGGRARCSIYMINEDTQ